MCTTIAYSIAMNQLSINITWYIDVAMVHLNDNMNRFGWKPLLVRIIEVLIMNFHKISNIIHQYDYIDNIIILSL